MNVTDMVMSTYLVFSTLHRLLYKFKLVVLKTTKTATNVCITLAHVHCSLQ